MGATAAMGMGAVSQAAGQYENASAVTAKSKFDVNIANLNAADAIARGNQQADVRASQGRQAIGAQRAAAAASGVDANSGTAADVQANEAKFTAMDVTQIRNNSAREAWGYTSQAALNAIAAQGQASADRTQAFSTLLTGAANSYGLYAKLHPKKKPTTDPGADIPDPQVISGDSGSSGGGYA